MTSRIIVDYDPPPFPSNEYDWKAVFDNYEPGCPIGFGKTAAAAVADLTESYDTALEDEAQTYAAHSHTVE